MSRAWCVEGRTQPLPSAVFSNLVPISAEQVLGGQGKFSVQDCNQQLSAPLLSALTLRLCYLPYNFCSWLKSQRLEVANLAYDLHVSHC